MSTETKTPVPCPACGGTGHVCRPKRRGRPVAQVDWDGVDWNQPITDIADAVHVSVATVRKYRPVDAPRITAASSQKRDEWDDVDWENERVQDIAKRLGVSRQRVYVKRNEILRNKG